MSENYAHSDLGNAQLFGELHSHHLKYRPDTQEWLYWAPNQHSWSILDRDEELKFAGYTARHRYSLISDLDIEGQRKEAAWALQSQNLARMQSMLAIAKSQEPIRSSGISWNAHPMLLSTPNGVIDLTTGTHREGRRNDFITQSIPVPYDETATCPRFNQFLNEIFDGDQVRISFLQRAIGYSLTGSTREQVFFLLYGTGANGKSRLRNVITELLGSYAHTVRFSAFEENPMSDAQRDLAELEGSRAVFASEGSERKKLDTSVLKYITGEEPIRTARKYGHPFTFQPQFKIWLSSNYLPRVDDDSHGFWRRVIILPFDVQFTGSSRDPYLESKLNAELPGILNWAIEGSRIWFKSGLQTPDSLLLQVSRYKDSRDTVSHFLQDDCEAAESGLIQANELYQAYSLWCQQERETPVTSTAFGRKVGEQFPRKRTNLGNFYTGIRLRDSLE